jgi:hypothetical protein
MSPSEHSSYLGKLVHNFQCLEAWLRFVLLKLETSQHAQAQIDFENLPVGTALSVNEVTDYASLAALIARFNARMASKGAKTLNLALVEIRDAIAHGRVIGTASGFPLRLVKFSKPNPKSGQVSLIVNEVMDQQWFELQILRTNRAIERVRTEV